LKISESVPAGFTAASASAPPPGSVLSANEIGYPWTTSGTYANNNFTLNGTLRIQTSYYYAGGQRVAMRKAGHVDPANNKIFYLLGDHLGSTSVTADTSGAKVSELRYKPWGETRFASGATPTEYQYTGQRKEDYIKLYWYGSRWYDPLLARWIQPDSIIPNPYNPLEWDRYQYVQSNPVNNFDPSGHVTCNSRGCDTIHPDDPLSNNVITLEVAPATALQGETGLEAQYTPINSPNYPVRWGDHYNLCGHIAFSAIYEAASNLIVQDLFWNSYPTGPGETSSVGGWKKLINNLPGWSATYGWVNWRNPQAVVSQPLFVTGVDWSPNGDRLAITASESFGLCRHLYILNKDGSGLQRLTETAGFYERPKWLENGEWISFRSLGNFQACKTETDANYFLIRQDGSNLTEIPNPEFDAISWSPLPPLTIGESYQISESGDDLKLRSSPSLNSKVIVKLKAGEIIQVFEGPKVTNGYIWWRIMCSDSQQGWVAEIPGWFKPTLSSPRNE
jgi:RHS repeat-associated protein